MGRQGWRDWGAIACHAVGILLVIGGAVLGRLEVFLLGLAILAAALWLATR